MYIDLGTGFYTVKLALVAVSEVVVGMYVVRILNKVTRNIGKVVVRTAESNAGQRNPFEVATVLLHAEEVAVMPVGCVVRKLLLVFSNPDALTRHNFVQAHIVFILVADVGYKAAAIRRGVHTHTEEFKTASLARSRCKLRPPIALVLPGHHPINRRPAFLTLASVDFVKLEILSGIVPSEQLVSSNHRMPGRIVRVFTVQIVQPVTSWMLFIGFGCVRVPAEQAVYVLFATGCALTDNRVDVEADHFGDHTGLHTHNGENEAASALDVLSRGRRDIDVAG